MNGNIFFLINKNNWDETKYFWWVYQDGHLVSEGVPYSERGNHSKLPRSSSWHRILKMWFLEGIGFPEMWSLRLKELGNVPETGSTSNAIGSCKSYLKSCLVHWNWNKVRLKDYKKYSKMTYLWEGSLRLSTAGQGSPKSIRKVKAAPSACDFKHWPPCERVKLN